MPDNTLNGPSPNGLAPSDAPFTVDDIISEHQPRTRSVQVCVRGDLRERFDDLDAQLRDMYESRVGEPSLGEAGELRALAEQVEAARAEIREHMRTFVFQSIGPNWQKMVAEHADDQGQIADFAAFVREAVSKCSVRPKIEPDKVQPLFDVLSQGDIDALYSAANRANRETTAEVPKSQLASRIREARNSSES